MGAKTWFIVGSVGDPKQVLANGPILDRDGSLALAKLLFPGIIFTTENDVSLDNLNPDKGEIHVGVYGNVKIVAHTEIGIDYLSRLNSRWRRAELGSQLFAHAMHSTVDWFAFAVWENGQLKRALSVSPDSGILENIGEKLPFEEPFWNGSRPPDGEDFEEGERYPLPFHPLEFAEEALLAEVGFQMEGYPSDWVCDPQEVPMMKLRLSKSAWWKFW